MITHTIEAKRTEVIDSPSPGTNLLPLRRFRIDGKLGYANFLRDLTFEVGDYALVKGEHYPFTDNDYIRICDIQEVMHFVKWHPTGEPKCLWGRDRNGVARWYAPCEIIRALNPPVMIPVK